MKLILDTLTSNYRNIVSCLDNCSWPGSCRVFQYWLTFARNRETLDDLNLPRDVPRETWDLKWETTPLIAIAVWMRQKRKIKWLSTSFPFASLTFSAFFLCFLFDDHDSRWGSITRKMPLYKKPLSRIEDRRWTWNLACPSWLFFKKESESFLLLGHSVTSPSSPICLPILANHEDG